MDYYLSINNSFERLLNEYRKYSTLTIAFDFDDTVFDFHNKGRNYDNIINLLRNLKTINCYLICWTGREDSEFINDYLIANNIPFDSINENPPFNKSLSRKVYANAYLDDRAGLWQVYDELSRLVRLVLDKPL